ncbi:hypothetical protein IAR55_004146 [Kwoniella newhampshirensis]|uniref:Protein kinase domain-containing protein n=1 Tax=Kwoniella newhampshirensis TaxID=1651941 RepID=A0AAW0Z1A5_9TREE
MTTRLTSTGPVVPQPSSSSSSSSATAANAFRVPRGKGLNRPTTWFTSSTFGKSSTSSSSSSSSSSTNSNSSSATAIATTTTTARATAPSPMANPFTVSSFKSPFPSSKGKHKLSPSPSPSPRQQDEDFVMISPVRPTFGLGVSLNPGRNNGTAGPSPSPSRIAYLQSSSMMRENSNSSSSPPEDSPTPACGMASATARLKLVDDDSPIRRVPGQSRSLARAGGDHSSKSVFLSPEKTKRGGCTTSPLKFSTTNLKPEVDDEGSPQLPPTPLLGNGLPAPPPQPLFPPIRTSKSQDGTTSQSLLTGSTSKNDGSRIPRLSASHPLRARAGTDAERPMLGQKKAISLDQFPSSSAANDELFGSNSHISSHVRKSRPASSFGSSGITGLPSSASVGRAHKRINSGDYHNLVHVSSSGSISRSHGAKSLALSLTPNLGPLPDFSHSNSSLSSLSTANLTPPTSAFSPAEPPIFEDVKPLQEAFEQPIATVSRKFKPRDSGVSMGDADDERPKPKVLIPPPSVMKPLASGRPRRPAMSKRTSSMGDERRVDMKDVETPGVGPMMASGWPGKGPSFDFLGESGAGLGFSTGTAETKPSMPDTPVKRHSFTHADVSERSTVGHSALEPTLQPHPLGSDGSVAPLANSAKPNMPCVVNKSSLAPQSVLKKPALTTMKKRPGAGQVPHLTLTTSSSPDWQGADEDDSSPTVRVGGSMAQAQAQGLKPLSLSKGGPRVGLLRRLSSGIASESEDDGTPTKDGGDRAALAVARSNLITPTPSPKVVHTATLASNATKNANLPVPMKSNIPSGIMPRLSLPAFPPPKPQATRTLHHRQSHPATGTNQPEEEDLFEKKFITLEVLGKGAFSTVVKVQDRYGEGLWAVKKARGVFDGVKDRLRHLEEVDILRHLSRNPCSHVIKFEDAWEQNRQLFIQTELCLGSLSFFLEEYGRVVERLDEGRVWKIVRELSDGLNHIHSNGVIHFDVKPANIMISSTGSLKIGDFGLATRWPRLEPGEILKGSGLGPGSGSTSMAMMGGRGEKLEREGDRVYMPPEMLRGVFVMAADIFSFGLVILEVSTNICVPDGGAPWQALRSNDFSVVDLSPLSPALCDLITQCMAADPEARPTIGHIVRHPVVQRARSGREALAPEEKGWLVDVLAGGFLMGGAGGEDVEMSEL